MNETYSDLHDSLDSAKDYHVKINNLQKAFPITRPSLFNKKVENYIALDNINLNIGFFRSVCKVLY